MDFQSFVDKSVEIFDKGATQVKGLATDINLVTKPMVRNMVRLCSDGWSQGWHERNGGNASYRLSAEEQRSCTSWFSDLDAQWTPVNMVIPELGNQWFVFTAAGSYMKNVASDTASCLGLIQLDESGSAYRVAWGFENDGRPTSELCGHLLMHAEKQVAAKAKGEAYDETGVLLDGCVLYHCHPVSVGAFSKLVAPEPRAMTQTLWKTMTETVMVIPEGIGVVPCMVPGSIDLAYATAEQIRLFNAVVWAHHGLLVSGKTCDEAFGLAHVIVKSCEIYLQSRQACAGGVPSYDISLEQVAEIAARLGIRPREDFLR